MREGEEKAGGELWEEGWEEVVGGGDGESGGVCVEVEERRGPRRRHLVFDFYT